LLRRTTIMEMDHVEKLAERIPFLKGESTAKPRPDNYARRGNTES